MRKQTYIYTILFVLLSLVYAEDKVNVYLKNGQLFSGTIKDSKFIEVYRSGYQILQPQNENIKNALLQDKKYTPASRRGGLRLWYVNHSNGFVYVPYKNIREIVWVGKAQNITQKVHKKTQKVKASYKDVLKERKQAREQMKQELEEEIAERERLEKEREEEARKKAMLLTQEEKEILQQFPPGAEWNSAERDKIHQQLNRARNNFTVRQINGRRVIQKTFFGGVNKKERTFYKNYDLWLKARDKQQELDRLKKLEEQKKLEQQEQQEDSAQQSPREQQDEVDFSEKN